MRRIAIVGGGSWATAIAKILRENELKLNWYMRNPDTISQFKQLSHNPRYLTGVEFDLDQIDFYNNLDEVVKNSDVIIFAVPSPLCPCKPLNSPM